MAIHHQTKNNNKGNLVITMAIALVVVVTLAMIMNYMSDFNKSLKRAQANGVVDVLFISLKGMLDNDITWKNILTQNTALQSCISTEGGNCASVWTGNLNVSGLGISIDNDPNSTKGFDSLGRDCNTFSKASPDPLCPYKFVVSWKLQCKDTSLPSCLTRLSPLTGMAMDPSVQISILFLNAAGANTATALNEHTYATTFTRGGSNSIEAACRLANADYDPKAQKCIVQTQTCTGGQSLRGFDNIGRPICVPENLLNSKCPSGYAGVGFEGAANGGGLSCFKY